MRILTIKESTNGKSLAFGRRGTYNPANREKGYRSKFQPGDASCPGVPARKAGISEQDPNASGPGGMQLLLRL